MYKGTLKRVWFSIFENKSKEKEISCANCNSFIITGYNYNKGIKQQTKHSLRSLEI